MIRVGLRFRRGDARVLNNVAQRIRAKELDGHAVTLFTQAADAAMTGEPMIVQCNDHLEAVMMADGFTRWGVARPAVEELTGQRPAK